MTIKFTEESCIHHSRLHSIFISLFGLIFQKRKNTNNYFKNIVIFETSKQNSSNLRLICYLLNQIGREEEQNRLFI